MDLDTNNNKGENNDVHVNHDEVMNDFIESFYENRHDNIYVHAFNSHTHDGVRDGDL